MKHLLNWASHFFQGWLGHATGTAVLGLLFTWGKSLKDDVKFGALLLNWRELISPLVVAVLVVLVITLVIKYVKTSRLLHSNQGTLKKLGVRLFSSHLTDEEKKSDWIQTAADLSGSNLLSPLWMLGATGKETFGSSTAPLCDVLRNYRQPVRILLLRPYSKGFDRRVSDLNTNSENYAAEILDAIDFCVELKKRYQVDIELRVYSEIAIWKMIITSTQLWLQYYAPKKHVDDTPLYCFESVHQDMGLYSALKSVFQKRWVLDQNPKINLDNWQRSSTSREFWDQLAFVD